VARRLSEIIRYDIPRCVVPAPAWPGRAKHSRAGGRALAPARLAYPQADLSRTSPVTSSSTSPGGAARV